MRRKERIVLVCRRRYSCHVTTDADYILGTHDDEIARLELQHRVWRSRAQGAWQRAGFTAGFHVCDLGCGPGFASLDLAALVGSAGHVTAIDQSRRFLDHLATAARQRELANIDTHHGNLDELAMRGGDVDGVWGRWVFAFVKQPRELLARVAAAMRPGATIAIHEYFDYATWRTVPPTRELDAFVDTVIESWRRTGGEPNIGMLLPRWLEELGFVVTHVAPIIDIVTPHEPQWEWLAAFVDSGGKRLASLGEFPRQQADAVRDAMRAWPSTMPVTRMVTPAVLEIIATRR